MIDLALRPRAGRLLSILQSTVWLRPLNDAAAIDDWLATIHPTWSLTAIRARVVDARRETPRARTLLLRPNRWWRGHQAGQHVPVTVEIDGRRHTRVFSISSAPTPDGLVAVTVQERRGGLVSAWWNRRATIDDVITLGPPQGDFVLPAALPRRLVLLSAGSGITPVMALLRALHAQRAQVAVEMLHSVRNSEDLIFADDLAAIARQWPALAMHIHHSNSGGRLGLRDFTALAERAGDASTFVCGPPEFAVAAANAWRSRGREGLLRIESFGTPRIAVRDDRSHAIRTVRSGVAFASRADASLLEAAEAAGLAPAFGCRAGICHTCACRKVDGAVRDLRTGAISTQPDEMIRLCVSAPCSELTLDL